MQNIWGEIYCWREQLRKGSDDAILLRKCKADVIDFR